MKKILCGLMVGVLLAGFAYAEQQAVYSRNAVGFVKVEVPRGALIMMQSPFETMDGNPATIGDIVGNDLPQGTSAYLWDADNQRWMDPSEQFIIPFFGEPRWDPGTNEIARGQGFFLRIPETAPQETYSITLMGEVPSTFTAPTSTVHLVEGLQIVGFMYPTAKRLSETALAQSAKQGDTIYVWQDGKWADEPAQYVVPFFDPPGWSPDITLEPGMAFFYRSMEDNPWIQPKTYNWP